MGAASDQMGADTTPVRDGRGFDVEALHQWMMANVSGYAGPVAVEQFKGGQSNPTFKLSTPGRNYVLRRKPSGPLVKGAHAVDREARVMAALALSGFPVPKVFGLCTDDRVIGAWFFVMELAPGRIFWDATFPTVGRAERPLYFDAMNRVLARLHQIDPDAIGLSDFGPRGNYFSRQISRWSKQYGEDHDAGRNPDMDELIARLPEMIPAEDETRIVHGDFRCDNMVFHAEKPEIVAVLDWELSTLGNPLSDFAYHSMMYRMPPTIVAGLAGADLDALNIPSEKDYVAAYCHNAGRRAIPDYEFYIAFNFFRIAAIFHGIKGRVIRGTAASARARDRAERFPVLARLAREALENCR